MSETILPLGQRLDDDGIDRLHALLERHAVPYDGMSLEMLDGFLSALVVGPELVMPSEYHPHIWNHEVTWETEEEAQDAHRLVGMLWNDIVSRVNLQLPDDDDDSDEARAQIEEAMPLLAFPEQDEETESDDPLDGIDPDFPIAAAWAFGFMHGVGLRADAWARWENDDDQIADDLETVAQLTVVDAEQAEHLGLDPDQVPDLRERLELAAALPIVLQNFHIYRLQRYQQQPMRREEGPGRNDPCPCGSGRKFKKCCGAPSRLN